jgi:hypothetical protein
MIEDHKINRLAWDKITSGHVASDFYDVPGFRRPHQLSIPLSAKPLATWQASASSTWNTISARTPSAWRDWARAKSWASISRPRPSPKPAASPNKPGPQRFAALSRLMFLPSTSPSALTSFSPRKAPSYGSPISGYGDGWSPNIWRPMVSFTFWTPTRRETRSCRSRVGGRVRRNLISGGPSRPNIRVDRITLSRTSNGHVRINGSGRWQTFLPPLKPLDRHLRISRVSVQPVRGRQRHNQGRGRLLVPAGRCA